MHKTTVINIVGLTPALIGEHTPFLKSWSEEGRTISIEPVLPAVTCSAQATYLTGKMPDEHGIVANGWYFRDECEVKLWRQSNKLVQAKKIWEYAKDRNPAFSCANMFWWYNMYSSVDYSVTPRPQYRANGLKIPDVYSEPASLRDELQQALGVFPLFKFWGPATSIASSQWIADASIEVDKKYDPTLSLIYLPHLDYNLQRHGLDEAIIAKDLQEIDEVLKGLIKHFESKGSRIILLSEYGITNVEQPIHINRVLRKKGWIAVREENGLELLDPGASKAFAMSDHQLAHVYVNDPAILHEVKQVLEETDGIERVLDDKGKADFYLDHERTGELVAVADSSSWFTYYYWEDDHKAPDFARTVDIHRKPGYDPVEMFVNPNFKVPMLKIGTKLMRKKLGFRYTMNVIPLDASLVKGSHGRLEENIAHRPLLISKWAGLSQETEIAPTQVYNIIRDHIFEE